jgi:hypothetical protein
MSERWLIRDYRSFWRLPEPLPPARWPRVLLALIVGEIVLTVAIAHAQSLGEDDLRALVGVIDKRDGAPVQERGRRSPGSRRSPRCGQSRPC